MSIEFQAIKIGDVAQVAPIDPAADSGQGESIIVVDDLKAEPGEIFKVPFSFELGTSANTISFTLDLNPSAVELIEISGRALQQKGHLDFLNADDGEDLSATWYSISEQTFAAGEILFEATFRATESLYLSKNLQISSRHAEAKSTGATSDRRHSFADNEPISL